ncbi:hypothetical protein chiPu_0005947 [Chiloscyllium punctatum]|uniref:Uncharacterized protein n=1 Tax=Chiloscyllium punctatum TaxID=137246 RepID=A0A401SAV4_CHIPU|nr:hypothetical protein [Chiloscyllium punctatum]
MPGTRVGAVVNSPTEGAGHGGGGWMRNIPIEIINRRKGRAELRKLTNRRTRNKSLRLAGHVRGLRPIGGNVGPAESQRPSRRWNLIKDKG